ncbi:putative GTP diphosphokinase [Nymphaea thermarum]|nr:putative GTP diphosphokinase [Nymphaea thermarum]
MGVPVALYSSPPNAVCTSTHACHISSHFSTDYDLNSRSSSSTSATAVLQKPMAGGLSCLFSSQTVKHGPSFANEDLGSLRHGCGPAVMAERSEELSGSFSYSSLGSSFKGRNQSPISVFHGPVTCSSVGSRSPPVRTSRDRCMDSHPQMPLRVQRDKLFNSFVRSALGFCVDYDSPSFPMTGDTDLHEKPSLVSPSPPDLVDEELTFTMDDNFVDDESFHSYKRKCRLGYYGERLEPYARDILLGAQKRHKIFSQELVVKAFCEAERAHRGQVCRLISQYTRVGFLLFEPIFSIIAQEHELMEVSDGGSIMRFLFFV